MAGVEATSSAINLENAVEADHELDDTLLETRSGHEAAELGQELNVQDDEAAEDPSFSKEPDTIEDTVHHEVAQPEAEGTPMGSVSALTTSKPATTGAGKDKHGTSTKTVPGKANPPTPTVKKVLNSGTFGTGTAKAASATLSKTTTLSKSTSTNPSAGKKMLSSSSANPPAKNPTMASSRTSTSGPPPPSRRASMVPPRAPSATGAPPTPKSRTSTLLSSLASSVSSRPVPAPSGDANASSRPSAASPSGSIASLKSNTAGASVPSRPRAAISESVKRTPSSSRQSLPPAAVLSTGPSRGMRAMSSISSIKEVRDDGKALEDLQAQLKEATENLSAKSEDVASLEARISELQASLDTALADTTAKASSLEQLQSAKQSSDAELDALKASLQRTQTEHASDLALLHSVKEELEASKQSTYSQTELIETLQSQIQSLSAEIALAQENFESLRASSDQSSTQAAEAAQMERESFLRAKADLEATSAEIEALRAAHSRALQDVATRLDESQRRAAEVNLLTTQIRELKAEKEESANKISELEVEILELRESQEGAEDEHNKLLDRLQMVEGELAQAQVDVQRALDSARVKEEEGFQNAVEVQHLHAEEVKAVKDDLVGAVAELERLKTALAAAHDAHDNTKAAAQAAAEQHEQEMEEAEQSYLSKHIELSEEIKRITAELESQEAQYNAKVDAVKTEHELLLQEAFERAKANAAEAHGQELQALRAESQSTIEQLCAVHESTVKDLRTEHEAAFDSQVNALEQRLNTQGLELRATQDDLAKAKAALDTSRSEGENLKSQLEDARAALIAGSANPDQTAEIERLNKELASLHDENVMLNDVLNVTKESLSEMSANHAKELEGAALGRVEEVMRLRAAHEGEISALAAQKSELALSLSDLEGEVATLRAQLAAVQPTITAKSNGAGPLSMTNVTREELQKVHEAHNLRMHDLQAEHDRMIRTLKAEVDTLQIRLDEVQQEVARKSMEIQYLEQEQEESQDSITRLKAELEQYKTVAL